MQIFERARAIILNPKGTWPKIRGEAADIKQLFLNYAAPLALIPAVSGFIGITLVGMRMPGGNVIRLPFLEALIAAAAGYIFNLAGVYIGGWLVKLLAPVFNSKPDLNASIKLVVYSLTPVWLVGIFSMVPGLGILSILGLYGIYLLALGLPVLLNTPKPKVVWYTIAILAAGLVVSLILSMILSIVFYGPIFMQSMTV